MPVKPPKKWFDGTYKKARKGIKAAHPKWGDKRLRKAAKATVGNVWYNQLTKAKRKEILKREEPMAASTSNSPKKKMKIKISLLEPKAEIVGRKPTKKELGFLEEIEEDVRRLWDEFWG